MPVPRTTRVVAIALSLAATGCVQKSKGDPRVLIIGVESDIKSLDFRTALSANTAHVMRLFSQGLVQLNEQLLPVPDLARSFQSEGARRFEFRLPADATFHDGTPVRCADVKASFEQAAGPSSRLSSSLRDVESLTCPSPDLFVIRLRKARASFLAGDVPGIRVLPAAKISANADFSNEANGSGPYRYEGRNSRDLIFVRNPRYRPLPFYEKVIVRVAEDPTTRFLSLAGGDIDMLFNALSPARVAESERDPHLRVYRAEGNTFQYLGFNLRLPKFRDVRVRRALSLAIDREAIIRYKLRGYARPATSVLSPGNYYYNADLPSPRYDPAEARRLLQAAGAQNLEVELKCSSDRDMLSILLVIQDAWEKIGVKVRLRPFEFGTFFDDVQKGNFEIYSLRWTSVTEPDLLNRIFHSREFPPGRNRTYYSNAEVDRLLDLAESEPQAARRRASYLQVQRIVSEELPFIPLWYPDNIAVANAEVRNFRLHPTGTWMTFLDSQKEPRL